ncbi:MAG: hypothetical protein R2711_10660 [Acidimicrobiales bacterium]
MPLATTEETFPPVVYSNSGSRAQSVKLAVVAKFGLSARRRMVVCIAESAA